MGPLLLVLRYHDERLLHALVLRRRLLLDRVMRYVTHLGDAATIIPLTLLIMAGAAPGLEGAGRAGAFALVASHLAVQLLKRTISRPRPSLPVGCLSLVEAPDRFSFPFGHSAASLSLALPLALALPPLGAGAVLGVAFLLGISRCYLGVHDPGDVLVGWLLAAAGSAAGLALL